MKTLSFLFKVSFTLILVAMMITGDVFGQVCESCQSGCTNGVVGTVGTCSFAQGDGSTCLGAYSVAIGSGAKGGTSTNNFAYGIGQSSYAEADGSYTFGCKISTSTSATGNIVIGTGGSVNFTNSIDNSIMIGTRLYGSVPSIFIEDALASSEDFGNIGIGTVSPQSRMHLNGTLRLGETTNNSGTLIFNNSAGNIITFNTPASMSDQSYILPTSQGANNTVLTTDASGNLSWTAPGTVSDAWLITGNSGTTTSNFLGTIDPVDLIIRTYNTEKMRVMAGGNVGIGSSAAPARLNVVDSGTEEKVAQFSAADASNDYLLIKNELSAANVFSAQLIGQGYHDKPALQFMARTNDDSGTKPLMVFDSRAATTTISTRPLFQWRNYSAAQMTMKADGNLGIGTTSPQGKLDVNGDVFIADIPAGMGSVDIGQGSGTGDQLVDLNGSKAAYKTNVQELTFDKEAFLGIDLRRYDWKEFYGGSNDVGMIAEEVEQQFPDLVYYGYSRQYLPNGDMVRDSMGVPLQDSTQMEVRGVKYHKLSIYLMALVKEQEQRLGQLEQQVAELASAISSCCQSLSEPSYRFNGNESTTYEKVEEYVLLRNDPNPFIDYTDITYQTDNCGNCQIVVLDMNGRLVKTIKVQSASGTIRIYSSEIGSGMFSYSLIENGRIVKTQKMISANK